ncbi:MAG: tRNA (guanosine(37)-N1)-methyltransferase TrmD [Patescibacteria group bacterium]
MRIDILTIFPEIVSPYLEASILGRAKKAGVKLSAVNLRDFARDKHSTTDDTPYGGGPGMVMLVEPIDRAVRALKSRGRKKKVRVILTSASGKIFTQADARRLSKYDHLIFIAGRYEGVDERVEEHIADESLSIGNYVLTGGELPALVMTDAVVRLQKGVLGNAETLSDESHNTEGVLEYPQYSKPAKYRKWDVPKILLSGDHKKINEWREEHRKSA